MTGAVVHLESPVGPLRLVSEGQVLTHVTFVDEHLSGPPTDPEDEVLAEAGRQLGAYFAGRLREFDIPLAPRGSAFQQRVWDQLLRIPFGATASYADIAARLGVPTGASRAVGLANGSNPIAIIVPCHRVIGSDGSLVGYAGGLHRKRFLLGLESPTVQDPLFSD